MGGSRWGTSSCPIDLKILPVITIDLKNSETEWADLNPQSTVLKTGLMNIDTECTSSETRLSLTGMTSSQVRVAHVPAPAPEGGGAGPTIKNNDHRYVRQLNLVLRLMYERYFFHIYRIYALQCFCSIFATYLLHICSILLHIAPYCYIFAPYLLHICKILMCLFVSQWQNQRSHAINKQL